MIRIFHFGPCWGMLDPSPYCTKLIAYARLASVPHELASGIQHINKAPKGKMPYIEHNGKLLADSSLVIEYLKSEYGEPLSQHLSDQQKAVTHAVGKMLDENFYWVIVHTRWCEKDNFQQLTRPMFFGDLPAWKNAMGSRIVRKKVLRCADGHGMGRHSTDEIYNIGIKDLKAVQALLGEQPFIFGEEPTEVDVYAYAFMNGIIKPPHESPVKTFMAENAALQAYHERMDKLVMMEPM